MLEERSESVKLLPVKPDIIKVPESKVVGKSEVDLRMVMESKEDGSGLVQVRVIEVSSGKALGLPTGEVEKVVESVE